MNDSQSLETFTAPKIQNECLTFSGINPRHRYNSDAYGLHRRRRMGNYYDAEWCIVSATGSRQGDFMECNSCFRLYGDLLATSRNHKSHKMMRILHEKYIKKKQGGENTEYTKILMIRCPVHHKSASVKASRLQAPCVTLGTKISPKRWVV